MSYYALVIDDPEKHHVGHVERNPALVHVKRAKGELHTHMDDACPNGLPNCRNCGDPAFAESCRAAGHCPHCGTRHGIAPTSYLARTGLVLKAIDPPPRGHVWDVTAQTFVEAK